MSGFNQAGRQAITRAADAHRPKPRQPGSEGELWQALGDALKHKMNPKKYPAPDSPDGPAAPDQGDKGTLGAGQKGKGKPDGALGAQGAFGLASEAERAEIEKRRRKLFADGLGNSYLGESLGG